MPLSSSFFACTAPGWLLCCRRQAHALAAAEASGSCPHPVGWTRRFSSAKGLAPCTGTWPGLDPLHDAGSLRQGLQMVCTSSTVQYGPARKDAAPPSPKGRPTNAQMYRYMHASPLLPSHPIPIHPLSRATTVWHRLLGFPSISISSGKLGWTSTYGGAARATPAPKLALELAAHKKHQEHKK
ncbi:hypothetical protein M431DRAFT_550937 [Trichoderma harzianum CBS 226.95]|uniref:Uncharacterized protein n=1 Tax=Trichoderma harzianum CBS 226.95 TaxID=983964 RepID=A0A2T4AI88_TRIHA|nr:hypothetical protein M431DRAFT_550937 [Trichoderma harzianum CBS 226.95]PTB56789.1 hypothetical protein M431DRAFT_550937 [Trichoderma harzianum CBS 226.95]